MKEIRFRRLMSWLIFSLLVIFLYFVGNLFYNHILKDKIPVTVYAPEDMLSAFKSALYNTNLKNDYKIVITDDHENADICVDYGKANDSSYTKFAYSPFVVGYNNDEKILKKLLEANTFCTSTYDKDYHEIDLLKVINEVNGDGKWSNLGLNSDKSLKVFYPSKATSYWEDFYNFMLVTVNGGSFPQNETEAKSAIEVINKFENSKYTEAVSNFKEKITQTNGLPKNAFYILPETTLISVYYETRDFNNFSLLFPLNTTYFNYYFKGNTDTGNIVLNGVNDSSFYYYLSDSYYRSVNYPSIKTVHRIAETRNTFSNVPMTNENLQLIEKVSSANK